MFEAMMTDELTWQHVGKGGIWSHLAPPQSGPHLSWEMEFFFKKLIIKKKAEKLIFDSTFNQSLDTFHPPLSAQTQGQPGRPSWPKTCCSGLAETQVNWWARVTDWTRSTGRWTGRLVQVDWSPALVAATHYCAGNQLVGHAAT